LIKNKSPSQKQEGPIQFFVPVFITLNILSAL